MPHYYHRHHLTRRGPVHDSGLSNQNIIAIAACATVGALVLGFIVYRVVRTIQAPSSRAPLPPIQPLAHHRERRLSQYTKTSHSRPATLYDVESLPPVPHLNFSSTSFHASKTSLLSKDSSISKSRHASYIGSEVGEQFSLSQSPLSVPSQFESALTASSSSFESGDHQVETPTSSSFSSSQPLSGRQNSVSQSSHRSRPIRSRPLSMSSTASTAVSRRSTIYGTPHGPHSNVQIVLPAPLAPNLFPYELTEESYQRHSTYSQSARLSIVDQWTAPPTRSSTPRDSREPRRFSSSSSRHSGSYSAHQLSRRSSTATVQQSVSPRPSSTPSVFTGDSSPPPVPRVPSIYSRIPLDTSPLEGPDGDVVRGRSSAESTERRAKSLPPAGSDPPRALLKRRDSRSRPRKRG